jgi:hypothetical protein
MPRISSCSCGKVKLTAKADPARVSICHCLACQKRTGSVFGVQARFERAQVSLEGETRTWVRVAEEEKITFHFCPTCGSTVYWFLEALPELVVTGVGNFADPRFPTPRVEVFGSRKHAWVDLSGVKLESYDVVNQ